MKFLLFCHAFSSCWNNGHAHFLRGVSRELIGLGHRVAVYELENGWSRANAIADGGGALLAEADGLVKGVELHRYIADAIGLERQLDTMLEDADVVLVHEWNEPALVVALGRRRERGDFRLLFVDAHHRAVTASEQIAAMALDSYDGVLAFGQALRDIYDRRGWARRAWVWHEAADTALFRPLPPTAKDCDLIWIGNWGDDERSRELQEFLVEPSARLRLHTRVHGVRYPAAAKTLLRNAGISFRGWLPNHRVAEAFARARATVHIPRQAYNAELTGIPTIRVFEALACGIPLICAPWRDDEGLFPPGSYLQARDAGEMTRALRSVLADRDLAVAMARSGREAILRAHTCRHRAEQLLAIVASLEAETVRLPVPETQTAGAAQ